MLYFLIHFFFNFQMWWNVLQQKQVPLFVTIKKNNWALNAFWMPYFSISHLFLKKEIKLNNLSSHTRGKKQLYDPFADICATDGQQLNRPKYRMTAWGKERTEIISTMTHTDFTTLEQLPPHKTHQVKLRLLNTWTQPQTEEDWVSMNKFQYLWQSFKLISCNYRLITFVDVVLWKK